MLTKTAYPGDETKYREGEEQKLDVRPSRLHRAQRLGVQKPSPLVIFSAIDCKNIGNITVIGDAHAFTEF